VLAEHIETGHTFGHIPYGQSWPVAEFLLDLTDDVIFRSLESIGQDDLVPAACGVTCRLNCDVAIMPYCNPGLMTVESKTGILPSGTSLLVLPTPSSIPCQLFNLDGGTT